MSAPSEIRHRLDSDRLLELFGETWPAPVVTQKTQSTNRDLALAARDGAASWQIHTTDHQVAGRGRLDRTFVIPDQAGVALSVLARPKLDVTLAWTWLPLVVGIAASEAFQNLGVDAVLKWPNDVLSAQQGRKLAGILVERVETQQGPAVVMGVGVNVSLRESELPTEQATSLLLENSSTLDRHEIVATLAKTIRAWVELWEAGHTEDIEVAYRQRCITIGQHVRIMRHGDEDVLGVAEGIDDFGCLIVDGRSWSAGDVEHVRPASSM